MATPPKKKPAMNKELRGDFKDVTAFKKAAAKKAAPKKKK